MRMMATLRRGRRPIANIGAACYCWRKQTQYAFFSAITRAAGTTRFIVFHWELSFCKQELNPDPNSGKKATLFENEWTDATDVDARTDAKTESRSATALASYALEEAVLWFVLASN